MVLFEISNITDTIGIQALQSGINKLPINCKIIKKKSYK